MGRGPSGLVCVWYWLELQEASDDFRCGRRLEGKGFRLQRVPNLIIPAAIARVRYKAVNEQRTRRLSCATRIAEPVG
jgi:hypothetical protein